jgi:acyl-CoA synthetase (AMP-forming)/AMP-acid ligase II/acyl carrier protein
VGVGRNDRVAILLPNGPEMAVAILGVASCATAAPLNPAYLAEELDFYLSNLKAKALMVKIGTNSPARTVAQTLGIPIIELSPTLDAESGSFMLACRRNQSPFKDGFAQPEDVALVLPTAGTTSYPKIVPLSHTILCASARNHVTALALGESDRCLNVMPLFHVHGLISAMLSSLLGGGSVFCGPGFHKRKFFDWMETICPTWYTASPAFHHAILSEALHRRESIAQVPLRFIRSAAAPLPPQLLMDLEQFFKAPVVESYGMTEACAQISSNPLPPRIRKPGSVGMAAGPEVVIMDEEANLMPANKIGEIAIRGENVMGGYENNSKANEAAFAKGYFRTGDQGYLDTDGYLIISGRLKELINRGGEKIAPREIDERLMDHPEVRQAVAFAVPHERLGEDIVAAVVLRKKTGTSEKEIREFLLSRLADFKVPSQIVFVHEIPKGPTGKVQRIGLARKLAPILSKNYVAPRNELENTLATIWAEVLGLDKVGVQDNFFALGGDSLLATRLMSRLRSLFQIQIPLVKIFADPTLAGQALLVEEAIITQIEKLSEDEAERLVKKDAT